MKQQMKSQRSRQLILDAGLKLFSRQGYRATSMKNIAEVAGISTGRVYHHFANKLQIYTTLIEDYWDKLRDPALKLNQLSAKSRFPEDFQDIVAAIREVVYANRESIMLIYIDVIEFRGEHIQRFYRDMAERFRSVFGERFEALRSEGRLNPNVDPLFAVMLTYRFFFQYFLVETSFGVKDHLGFSAEEVAAKAEDLVLHGLLSPQGAAIQGSEA